MRGRGNLLIRRALDESQKFLTKGRYFQVGVGFCLSTEQRNNFINRAMILRPLFLTSPAGVFHLNLFGVIRSYNAQIWADGNASDHSSDKRCHGILQIQWKFLWPVECST